MPLSYAVYRWITTLAAPLVVARERKRMAEKGIPSDRRQERFGRGYAPRPDGAVVWINAVSLGETRLALMLAEDLRARTNPPSVLITTTTETAAETVASARLPGVYHAFGPVDLAAPVARFFNHWQPDAGVFVESELWPRLILSARQAGVPLALINARLSHKSLANWRRMPRLGRALVQSFELILTQTEPMAAAFVSLGAKETTTQAFGDLKELGTHLPFDAAELAHLRLAFGEGPRWVAASTHPGEEEILAGAHGRLRRSNAETKMILVPRHPERGREIAETLRTLGHRVSRRSGEDDANADIYIADTLGELGLWYRLAPVAVIGGSICHNGGHNPYEATSLGCFALTGPGFQSFEGAYEKLVAQGEAEIVGGGRPEDFAEAIARRLDHEGCEKQPRDQGQRAELLTRLSPILPKEA